MVKTARDKRKRKQEGIIKNMSRAEYQVNSLIEIYKDRSDLEAYQILKNMKYNIERIKRLAETLRDEL